MTCDVLGNAQKSNIQIFCTFFNNNYTSCSNLIQLDIAYFYISSSTQIQICMHKYNLFAIIFKNNFIVLSFHSIFEI